MKILHTTDLHFNKEWFAWIEAQQKDYDIFCISGDFLESSKEETLLEQIEWISSWIRNFKKPLFVCSGNHDIEELDNEDWLNKICTSDYYADGMKKRIGNVKFGCYPYIGAEGYYEFDECNILITHIPPSNTKTSTNRKGNDWGDSELSSALKNKTIQPQIILCGHMHRPIKTIDTINKTTIYNPGVNKSNKTPNFHAITFA